MTHRVCRLPTALVGGVVVSLRQSGRFTEEPASGEQRFVGRLDGHRVEVRRDGTIVYAEHGPLRAVIVQAIKGTLGPPRARFLLGIDESGVGGESNQAYLALVMLGEETRADLIADGVRDSKSVSSAAELDQLAATIRDSVPLERVVPLPRPGPGESYARIAARTAGSLLAELAEAALLPVEVAVCMDNVPRETMLDALGPWREELGPRIRVEPRAETHVEVACASILATSAAKSSGRPTAPRVPARPTDTSHFTIGNHRDSDKDQVVAFLHELVNAYPDIGRWIGQDGDPKSVWAKVLSGTYHLTVARLGEQVAGFCITQHKDARNAKISTFYVAKRHRGKHIGPGILQRELGRLARNGFRRVMVTFAHEEFFEMQPFLTQYGFTVDGISPQRYRDNSYEVVMGKRFRPGVLTLAEFRDFIQEELFRLQGYNIEMLGESGFLATPRQDLFAIHQLPPGRQFMVRVTTAPNPEGEVETIRKDAAARGAHPVLASAYGFPAGEALPNDVLVYDAYGLESQFFPMSIERPDDHDLVIPIQPEFAQRLMPRLNQTTFAPSKLALRMENVYYRVHDGKGMARRGARLFFYESQGRGVFCTAKLKGIAVGGPRRLYSKFGGMGAWGIPELETHAKGRDLQAFRFDWLQEFQSEVVLDDLRSIHPGFNPISVVRIASSEGNQLLARGKPR